MWEAFALLIENMITICTCHTQLWTGLCD